MRVEQLDARRKGFWPLNAATTCTTAIWGSSNGSKAAAAAAAAFAAARVDLPTAFA